MNKFIYFTIALITLFACGENQNSSEASDEANAANEEVKEQVLPEIFVELSKSLKDVTLPFKAKSEIFEKFDASSELSPEQFNLLRSNYQSIYRYDNWYLDECVEIYEMKQNGSFEEYQNSLDIGMLSDCTAHPYGITRTPEAILFYWFIDYSSYEACPYFSGRELFVSKIVDGNVVSCLQMGGDSSGGDPPVSGSSVTEFSLESGFKLYKLETDESFEDDLLISKEQRDTTVTF